jgi:transcription initiation factor TFIIH subunit 2
MFLRHIPSHASREVLVVMGSLTSCDPGNIFTTIEELSKQSIRVNIIGLAAEVRLCKLITQKTQGVYSVIMNESHFRDLMIQHCRPPPAKAHTEASLIKMGFPTHLLNGPLTPCLCHLEKASLEKITADGYFCPQVC